MELVSSSLSECGKDTYVLNCLLLTYVALSKVIEGKGAKHPKFVKCTIVRQDIEVPAGNLINY